MNKKDIKLMFFLAYKNIIKSKSTFIVIVAVMAMSFLSITFFSAIIDGLSYEFEESMIDGQTGHLMIEPSNEESFIFNSDRLEKNISKIPGVIGVSSRLESNILITYKNEELGAPVFFIDPIDEQKVSNFHESLIEGSFLSYKDTSEIIIGSDLLEQYAPIDDTKKRFNLRIGDNIILTFNNGYKKEYKIKGIFKTGSKFNDDKILINKEEYFSIFNKEDISHKILVKLPSRGLEKEYIQKIEALGIIEQINPWETKIGMIKQFVGSLQITNQITGFIGLLTAFATIYIIIFINVTNKRKQIGILKAIGIKKKIILGSYIIQSFIYGFVGVIFGNIIMQILLALLASYPLSMPIGDVVPLLTIGKLLTTSFILILASIVAGFFPSRKASNDNILDAIFGG
ncbi:ABC transporter permease [archaeon]|nr:ABC transporter permease [archaeon]NCP79535.1 ABC transporter permease [archaeon]NCP97478.1 ABC transporter permease [archaeon]NCQ07302.1 ABC transporter permease [archaeon]NCQ51098.1 ABC transporter permease [archaeon]